MSVINEFLVRYEKEFDYYQESARICAQKCEKILEDAGIRAIVSYRAKKPVRLKEKIEKRNEEKNYQTVDEIYKDIVDLAGVRIALYFSGEQDEVKNLIDSLFDIKQHKPFPDKTKVQSKYSKRFSGYSANHYRVQLKEENLTESEKRYIDALIEIQVASVLMHAWSEVEHDLAYKPFSGELSEDEYAILDELNGLVLSGEIALERLQRAVKLRVEGIGFRNHYELSSFLYDMFKSKILDSNEPIMGRADILLEFLKLAELDHPKQIKEYISELEYEIDKKTISEQLIDRILAKNPDLFNIYKHAQNIILDRNLNSPAKNKTDENESKTKAIGFFISSWSAFDSAVMKIIRKRGITDLPSSKKFVNQLLKDMVPEVNRIREIRNEVVHRGISNEISPYDLVQKGKVLIDILQNKIHDDLLNEEEQLIMDEALRGIPEISDIDFLESYSCV